MELRGGGTTAIILQCIDMLGLDKCKVYSIDYSEKFYRDSSINSGYLGEEALKLLPGLKDRHKFLLGNIACTWNDELKDCDFLIIDTTHVLPGEVLDYITLLPILKDGAVIILHDICLNQIRYRNSIATGVVFAAASGEKYMNWDGSTTRHYPNIGAVVVNEDTRKNIWNMFLTLLLTWTYLPDSKQVDGYRSVIKKYYNEDLIRTFDDALELNRQTYRRSKGGRAIENAIYSFPFHRIKAGVKIVLFGAGEEGKSYSSQVNSLKYCDIVKWVDPLWESIGAENVVSPDIIDEVEYDYIVIATMQEKYAKEIKLSLLKAGVDEGKIIWEG